MRSRRLAFLGAAAIIAATPAAASAANPLFTFDGKNPGAGAADPGMAVKDGIYYVASTKKGGVNRGLVRSSTDLRKWTYRGAVFTRDQIPGWVDRSGVFEAPEIEFRPSTGLWHVVFAAKSNETGKVCLGSATSKNPYDFSRVSSPRPLLCSRDRDKSKRYSVIDPSIFRDPAPNGRLWILFKRDFRSDRGQPTKDIVIRPLSEDGTKVGLKRGGPLIKAETPWEGVSVEAPTMIYRDPDGGGPAPARYYLFYSGGNYKNDTYAVGVAVSPFGANTPTGGGNYGFKRFGAGPILTASPSFGGVGHQDVVGDLLFYHARDKRKGARCKRRCLMADAIRWDRPGGNPRGKPPVPGFWPSINNGTPSQ